MSLLVIWELLRLNGSLIKMDRIHPQIDDGHRVFLFMRYAIHLDMAIMEGNIHKELTAAVMLARVTELNY